MLLGWILLVGFGADKLVWYHQLDSDTTSYCGWIFSLITLITVFMTTFTFELLANRTSRITTPAATNK
jgi:hypothetical protein